MKNDEVKHPTLVIAAEYRLFKMFLAAYSRKSLVAGGLAARIQDYRFIREPHDLDGRDRNAPVVYVLTFAHRNLDTMRARERAMALGFTITNVEV